MSLSQTAQRRTLLAKVAAKREANSQQQRSHSSVVTSQSQLLAHIENLESRLTNFQLENEKLHHSNLSLAKKCEVLRNAAHVQNLMGIQDSGVVRYRLDSSRGELAEISEHLSHLFVRADDRLTGIHEALGGLMRHLQDTRDRVERDIASAQRQSAASQEVFQRGFDLLQSTPIASSSTFQPILQDIETIISTSAATQNAWNGHHRAVASLGLSLSQLSQSRFSSAVTSQNEIKKLTLECKDFLQNLDAHRLEEEKQEEFSRHDRLEQLSCQLNSHPSPLGASRSEHAGDTQRLHLLETFVHEQQEHIAFLERKISEENRGTQAIAALFSEKLNHAISAEATARAELVGLRKQAQRLNEFDPMTSSDSELRLLNTVKVESERRFRSIIAEKDSEIDSLKSRLDTVEKKSYDEVQQLKHDHQASVQSLESALHHRNEEIVELQQSCSKLHSESRVLESTTSEGFRRLLIRESQTCQSQLTQFLTRISGMAAMHKKAVMEYSELMAGDAGGVNESLDGVLQQIKIFRAKVRRCQMSLPGTDAQAGSQASLLRTALGSIDEQLAPGAQLIGDHKAACVSQAHQLALVHKSLLARLQEQAVQCALLDREIAKWRERNVFESLQHNVPSLKNVAIQCALVDEVFNDSSTGRPGSKHSTRGRG